MSLTCIEKEMGNLRLSIKPSKNSILQQQWTKTLHDKSITENSDQLHRISVLFTIDENNKVEILNLSGTSKETYKLVKQQLNGLDNISDLTPNEVYKIEISFQVV